MSPLDMELTRRSKTMMDQAMGHTMADAGAVVAASCSRKWRIAGLGLAADRGREAR